MPDYKITVTLDGVFVRNFTLTESGRSPEIAVGRQLKSFYPKKWRLLKWKQETVHYAKQSRIEKTK